MVNPLDYITLYTEKKKHMRKTPGSQSKELPIFDDFSKNTTPNIQISPKLHLCLWTKAPHHPQWPRGQAQKSPLPSLSTNIHPPRIFTQCAAANQTS